MLKELMHVVDAHTERRLTYLFSNAHTDHSHNERPDIELRVTNGGTDARVYTIHHFDFTSFAQRVSGLL